MKYTSFLIGAIFIFFSCAEKKDDRLVSNQNRDTVTKYFNAIRAQKSCIVDTIQLLTIENAAKTESSEYKALAKIARGMFYSGASSYELAIQNYEQALPLIKREDADTIQAIAYTGIGNSYKHTGDYPKALNFLYKGLEIFENRKNPDGISRVNGLIGEVYVQKNDLELAKEHLKIALKILDNEKTKIDWLSAAHTLANVYGMSGDYESALKIDEQGIKMSDSVDSPESKSMFFDNKANCYLYSGKLDSAQIYFEKCLVLDLASGNKKQIADTYSNLGNLAAFQKDFKKAEALTLKSIAILKTINNKFNLSKSYKILSEIYQKQGDYKKALETYIIFNQEYKKMISDKKEAALAEFKIVHDAEKNEKLLAENKVELLQTNAEVKQRNDMLIVLSVFVAFILLVGFLVYRQQNLKNQQQQHEHDLKTAISLIETQNKLQNQRLAISRDLHDNIGAQLTFIISSVDNIKYAFDIKNSKLDDKLRTINTFAKDTIVELRDTIWAMNNSEIAFEDLRIRIMNFIEKAKEAQHNIDFKFAIAPELHHVTLGSIPGMNIYRTIQEAVNNALKYADATEISIVIFSFADGIQIIVRDNGSGYDTETVQKGNGLGNMEKRISDIGGSIVMESHLSQGTTITIQLPQQVASKAS